MVEQVVVDTIFTWLSSLAYMLQDLVELAWGDLVTSIGRAGSFVWRLLSRGSKVIVEVNFHIELERVGEQLTKELGFSGVRLDQLTFMLQSCDDSRRVAFSNWIDSIPKGGWRPRIAFLFLCQLEPLGFVLLANGWADPIRELIIMSGRLFQFSFLARSFLDDFLELLQLGASVSSWFDEL